MAVANPALMVEEWLKRASEIQRPSGVGDVQRAQSSLGKGRQQYTQPVPPIAATRPDLINSQKAMSPPPA
mgnify:CR=1 FL=1